MRLNARGEKNQEKSGVLKAGQVHEASFWDVEGRLEKKRKHFCFIHNLQ